MKINKTIQTAKMHGIRLRALKFLRGKVETYQQNQLLEIEKKKKRWMPNLNLTQYNSYWSVDPQYIFEMGWVQFESRIKSVLLTLSAED